MSKASKTLTIGLAAGALLLSAANAQATTITYAAVLNGGNEVPPNASPGIGFATVIVDDVANTMDVNVVFSGLLGPTTASHIHCCTALPFAGTAGVATVTPTFTGFPSGVTSGTYSQVFDMTLASSYNSAFVTANGSIAGAEAALFGGLANGSAYLNIHTSVVPAGEIRGFLQPVPEPSTLALVGLGIGSAIRRRRRAR